MSQPPDNPWIFCKVTYATTGGVLVKTLCGVTQRRARATNVDAFVSCPACLELMRAAQLAHLEMLRRQAQAQNPLERLT